MKTTYNWNSETGAVEIATVETKSVEDVCRVLAKHGPGELADRFIGMCCIETGYDADEDEWYRVHQAIQTEADQESPDQEYLTALTLDRTRLEERCPWLTGYRGEDAPEPPEPMFPDRDAFIAAHWAKLRAAAYGDMGKQLGMRYDDEVNGTSIWVDHCAAVKAAFPKPIA